MFQTSRVITYSSMGACFLATLILTIILGVIVSRNRSHTHAIPALHAASTARNHSDQLSRINTIILVLAIQYVITSVGQIMAPVVYFNGRLYGWKSGELLSELCYLIASLGIAARLVLLLASSPRLRTEFVKILRCEFKSRRIDPKSFYLRKGDTKRESADEKDESQDSECGAPNNS